MKKICFVMFLAFFLHSCSDDVVQPDMKELVLERIEENSFVLEEAFARTTEILHAQGDLETLVAKSATRDAFITKMNELVDDVVPEVVQAHGKMPTKIAGWNQVVNSTSIQNNLKQIAVGIDGPNPGSGALGLYSTEIDNKLDLLQGNLLLVENHRSANGDVVPTDQFSLNFSEVKFENARQINGFIVTFDRVQEVKETIGNMTLSFSGLEGLGGAVVDFVEGNPDTEIFIQLLLPAILTPGQKTSGGPVNGYTGLTNIAFSALDLKEKELWDKQVRYAAFLAAVDFIISGDFDNYDEDHAAIPVQDAMHHAVCVLTWSKIYDLYKR